MCDGHEKESSFVEDLSICIFDVKKTCLLLTLHGMCWHL